MQTWGGMWCYRTEAARFFLTIILLSCSGVEEPDLVFSVEQTRCEQLPEAAEPQAPQLATKDCETSDISNSNISNSDPDGERLVGSSPTEDAGLNPSSATELFFKLKELPEELFQLAPEAGSTIFPLTEGETHRRYLDLYVYKHIYTSYMTNLLPKKGTS